MEELLDKIDNLKKELDKAPEVVKIKELKKELQKDQALLQKIKTYQMTYSNKTKDEILANKLYNEYRHALTDLNILILKINQELNKINDRGNNKDESN